MRDDGFVCLTYHELSLPGRPTCGSDGAYMRYVVSATAFVAQIRYLRDLGLRGCTVTEALRSRAPVVALSFDDGTATDIEVAAPEISQAGFTATSYVVANWVGESGRLRPADLRRLVDLGFEIGSHSMTHPFLPRITPCELRRELQESKQRLEDWTGTPVLHFSCPYGAYSSAVIAAALEAGYATVATSEVGVNQLAAKLVNRVTVRQETSLAEFRRISRGKLMRPRARQFLLSGLRRAVGLPVYAALCRIAPARKRSRLQQGRYS